VKVECSHGVAAISEAHVVDVCKRDTSRCRDGLRDALSGRKVSGDGFLAAGAVRLCRNARRVETTGAARARVRVRVTCVAGRRRACCSNHRGNNDE